MIDEKRNSEMWEIADKEMNRVTKEIAELKQHLKEIEWNGKRRLYQHGQEYVIDACPACYGLKDYSCCFDEAHFEEFEHLLNHKEDCWLHNAIKEVPNG